jgi:uncharacterized membrane protein
MRIAKRHLALGGALLVGLLLRLAHLGSEPYWGDEVLSLDIALHFASVGEMIRYVSEVEFHPPLYYLLLKPWIGWFGEGEAATRSLSLVFSTGTIAAVYAAGMAIFRNAKAALTAAFVTAVLPMQVEFGQEARPYAIYAFFGTLALLALWKHLRTGRFGWAAMYVLSSLAGLYLHYSYLFFFVPTALWWLFEAAASGRGRRGRAFAGWAFAHGAVFLGFFPWLDSFFYKYFLSAYDLIGLSRAVPAARSLWFVEIIFNQSIWMTKPLYVHPMEILANFVFKAAAAFAVLAAAGKKAGRAVPCLLWLSAAPVAFFLFSPQSYSYAPLYVRHAIVILVPLALLFGKLVSSLKPKPGAALAALFFVTLVPSLARVVDNDAVSDYRHRIGEIGSYINAYGGTDDLVIVPVSSVRSDIAHFVREEITVASLEPVNYLEEFDLWGTRRTLGLIENEAQIRLMNSEPGEAEIGGKLERLIARHRPERVWLYAFTEPEAHRWFAERGWRRSVRAVLPLFLLDRYDAP